MKDKFVEETHRLQNTTLTTNIHTPSGIRTHNVSRLAAAELPVLQLRKVKLRLEQATKRVECSRRRRDAMYDTSLDNSAIANDQKDEPIVCILQ
jgi:hypothetical protein